MRDPLSFRSAQLPDVLQIVRRWISAAVIEQEEEAVLKRYINSYLCKYMLHRIVSFKSIYMNIIKITSDNEE